MNVIQAQHINDHSDHNQAEALEHLSTFIQLFRRTVSLGELVTILIAKEQDYSTAIEKIKLVFEQLEPLKEHYQQGSGFKPLRQITFHRFTCRLLEIIHLYNAKHKESPESPPYSYFLLALREIQHAIKKYEESRMLVDIIKITQLSFLKFCINSKKGARKIGDESERKCEETFSQLKKAVVKLDRINFKNQGQKKQSIEEQFSSDQSQQSEKCICPTVSITSFNKIPALSKDLQDIQKRFDAFRGLDLDFNSFRSDFFMAKNNKDDFFRQFLKRNELNKRLITTYHDDFYLFQKKKINKENRRNKFKHILGPKNLTQNSILKVNTLREMLQQSIQHQKTQINCETQSNQNFASVPGRTTHDYRAFQMEEEISAYSLVQHAGKKQLRMKNVQLSLGKNRGQKTIKGAHNIFKNISKIQPMCINKAYYNELQTQSKDSVEFLHSKLRIDPKSKYKTQISRNQTKAIQNVSLLTESEVIKKQIDPISLAIKSRSTFKGKYLEINCVTKNQDTQIKRRVFHNGASLTKVGIKNGYKIENNCKVVINLH